MVICWGKTSLSNRLTLISLVATDIVLLLMMLVGLFRLRHDGYGSATFGLAQFLWKQVWGIFSCQSWLLWLIECPPFERV